MSLKVWETDLVSRPIAKEVVGLLINNEVCYQQRFPRSLIAQEILEEETKTDSVVCKSAGGEGARPGQRVNKPYKAALGGVSDRQTTLHPTIHQKGALNMENKLLLNTTEAAKLLNITSRTLQRLSHIEGFPCIHIGRRILIPAEGLQEWVRQNTGNFVPTGEESQA